MWCLVLENDPILMAQRIRGMDIGIKVSLEGIPSSRAPRVHDDDDHGDGDSGDCE